MAQSPAPTHPGSTRSSLSEAKKEPGPSSGQDTAEDTADEKASPKTGQPVGPELLSGPTTPTVRITNIYVQGGGGTDVQVTKTNNGNLVIPMGTSALVPLSDVITAIAAVATTGGATSRTPVDIG